MHSRRGKPTRFTVRNKLIHVHLSSGQAHDQRIHAPVPVWRFLRIREAEGAGDQEHSLDIGVCGAAPPS